MQHNLELNKLNLPDYPSENEIIEIKSYADQVTSKYKLRTIKSHFKDKYSYNKINFAINC